MHPFWQTAQAILEVERARGDGVLEKEVRALEQLLGGKRNLLRQAKALAESGRQPTLFQE
jgi:hypothetical protein